MGYEQPRTSGGVTTTVIQNSTHTYAADAEASDTYAITLSPAPSAYAAGQSFKFKANTANTGGATLNVNALGAKTILKNTDQALATGDIEAGSIVEVTYDGTNFQLGSVDSNLTAAEIANVPAGSIAATTVQAAIDELDSEKQVAGSYAAALGGDDNYVTDAEKTKIAGIEALADVTDAANVDAAGATMNADTTLAGNGYFLDEDAMGSDSATKVPSQQSVKAYVDGRTPAASTTVAGLMEASIASEVTTGTDTARAVTPDSLSGSDYGKRTIELVPFDSATNNATGDGKAFFRIPSTMNGWNLVAVAMQVYTAGTTNTLDVQIRRKRSGSSADMLSTKLKVDSTEVDSSTAAAAVIDGSNDDVATGDLINVDVDAVHTTPAVGLVVELTFQLP